MVQSLLFKQITLLLSGCMYYLMVLLLPMAGGGVGIIGIIFAPFTLGCTFVLMLIQKLLDVFCTSNQAKNIYFTLCTFAILAFTFGTFPFR